MRVPTLTSLFLLMLAIGSLLSCGSPTTDESEPVGQVQNAFICATSNPCLIPSGTYPNCVYTPRPKGYACTTSTCGGTCNGQGTCVACEDWNACTNESCLNLFGNYVCQRSNVANNTTCSDGNACTLNDKCQNGTCTPSATVFCTALDQCHNAGTCNTTTGVCTNPIKSNGTTCNDGNACTQTDTCQSGTCTGGNPKVCTALSQCHNAGTCNPSDGVCSNPTKPNGTWCTDNNACTQTDTCQSGTCTGGNPKVCTPLSQCHNVGSCNTSTGICSTPTKQNGTACDDQDACTYGDACWSGYCEGEPLTEWDCWDGNQCTYGACDSQTGCYNYPRANGTSCTDGNQCTQSDSCQAGTCTGANPVVCPPPIECHEAGSCVPSTGQCFYPMKPGGSACTDNNACTLGDNCQNGTCTPTTSVVCTASSQCHNQGTCDPGSGICSNPQKANGSWCTDDNACTQSDSCQSGACTGTNPVVCTALSQCHDAGACDPSNGTCSNPAKPNGSWCEDGNLCTQTDTCQAGSCTGSNPVVCTPLNECRYAGTCNPGTGLCSSPEKQNGTYCNDQDPCTAPDSCWSGYCEGEPLTEWDCWNGNPCMSGACSSPDGCYNIPRADGTLCTDQNACTEHDACESGTCTGSPVSLDDENSCTADSCDSVQGVRHEPLATGSPCEIGSQYSGRCNDAASCTSPPLSEPVAPQDASVRERRLGRGRHPIAVSSSGIAVAFVEVLSTGNRRIGVATFSLVGEPRGVWYRPQALLDADPVLAPMPDGSFALAFNDLTIDGDGLGIAVVRIGANAQPVGSPIAANQTSAFGQHSPDIQSDGTELWIAWEDESQASAQGGRRICRRRFSSTLAPLEGEICDSATGHLSRVVLASTTRGLARAFRKESNGLASIEVRYATRSFELLLTEPPGARETPAIVELDSDNILVVYPTADGQHSAIVLNQSGSAGDAVLLTTQGQFRYEPSITKTPDGIYLAWREPTVLYSSQESWYEPLDELLLQRAVWNGSSLVWAETITLPHNEAYCAGDQTIPALASVPLPPSGAIAAAWNDLLRISIDGQRGEVRMSLMPTPIVRPEGGE